MADIAEQMESMYNWGKWMNGEKEERMKGFKQPEEQAAVLVRA